MTKNSLAENTELCARSFDLPINNIESRVSVDLTRYQESKEENAPKL